MSEKITECNIFSAKLKRSKLNSTYVCTYSHDHRKPAGVSRICSCGLSFHLSKTKRVPFESSTQGLSDGTLKPDLGLNTASPEAKNMKKWTS